MSDRKVTVNEADLRSVERALQDRGVFETRARRRAEALIIVRAALDALGPEPCGHPSRQTYSGSTVPGIDHRPRCPTFRCVAPKGHHALAAWSADEGDQRCCGQAFDDPIHCGDEHIPPDGVWASIYD